MADINGIFNLPQLTSPALDHLLMVEDNEDTKKMSIQQLAELLGIRYNDIGEIGKVGAGVGICDPKELPTELDYLGGTIIKGTAEWGNYRVKSDGSIVVCVPIHYYKIGANNIPEIKSIHFFSSEAIAATLGFMIPDCFTNAGEKVNCVFVDKYDWSLTGYSVGVSGIASSIKNGNPISSNVATKRDVTNVNHAGSFSNCISNSQNPTDTYAGASLAAKSRGSNFWQIDTTVWDMIANISMACGWITPSVSVNAWYDSAGIKNYPKGNNNYGSDYNDPSVTFSACDDSYWSARNEARKTGSGGVKTSHNGQECGIYDVNGNQFNVLQGVTCIASAYTITNLVSTDGGTKIQVTLGSAHGRNVGDWAMFTNTATTITDRIYKITDVVDTTNIKIASTDTSFSLTTGTMTCGKWYRLKRTFDIVTLTSGTSSSATDMYNSTFIANNCDEFYPNFVDGGVFAQKIGNGTNQVIEFSTDKTSQAWKRAGACMPKEGGVSSSGTNMFGQDYFYQYITNYLAVIVAGNRASASGAGVRHSGWHNSRSSSITSVSSRSCLYAKKRAIAS